eukprot:m.100474 g.100474  ORF g.100474 m.100474 type:complete len:381 (-) comp15627_c0_seq2:343-1485(-)
MSSKVGVQALSATGFAALAARRMAASSSAEPTVQMRVVGNFRQLVLNRPKALNALDVDMVRGLRVAGEWDKNPSVAVIVMTGAGEKAFCAGGDVVTVAKSGSGKLGDGGAFARDFFAEEYKTDYLFATLKKPYVALIDGIVMGGGVGLSVHGKYRVATERTLFAMPETGIGLFPDVGGSFFLPRLKGRLGFFLGLTGHRLKGAQVLHAGVATHYIQSSDIPALLKSLEGLQRPNLVQDALDSFHRPPSEPAALDAHAALIDHAFGADSPSEIVKRLETAAGASDAFAQETLKTLRKMCPLSVCVSFEQLTRGASMTLADCLKMEYRLTQHVMTKPDFFEGVRALLLDKDQKPKWAHARIEDVTKEEVDAFFLPAANELKL